MDATALSLESRQARTLARAAALCLLLGLAWRLSRYLLQFPIWGDEAFILLDVQDRDYAGLTQVLTYWQVAPLLFLWGQKFVVSLLGTSELAVHLLPFLASVLGLILFACLARLALAPLHGTLAVAILAVSYYPVRHGCEAKPYSLDLLMATALLLGAAGWLHTRRLGWLVYLTLLVPLALCASYPVAFVAGAVSLALLPTLRQARWPAWAWCAAFNLLMVTAFLGHYFIIGHNQAGGPAAAQTDEFLHRYWQASFPPASPLRWPLWLVQTHTGGLLAYPVGGPSGGSTAWLLLALVGGWYLWSRDQQSLLLLCTVPFALTLIAACFGAYPYGGSARIAQHLAPAACVLIAAGGVALLERLHCAERWAGVVCLLLAGVAVGGMIRDFRKPYKTDYDRFARDLVHRFAAQVDPAEPVVYCNRQMDVVVNYQWYLQREFPRIAWQGRAYSPAEVPGVWLLHFGLDGPPAAALQAHVPGLHAAWSVATCEHYTLPREASGDATVVWTKVHLVPTRYRTTPVPDTTRKYRPEEPMPPREPRNPLYLLLLIIGMVFVLTVLAYALVPVLEEKARDAGTVPPPSPFRDALRRDGWKWVLGEVALLVIIGLMSMGLDRWRRWRHERAQATDVDENRRG